MLVFAAWWAIKPSATIAEAPGVGSGFTVERKVSQFAALSIPIPHRLPDTAGNR
jgi:hypothetical protein